MDNTSRLAEPFFDRPENYKDPLRQRVYLKDIDCPLAWHDKLRDILPSRVFYWNDNCGDVSGPGAVNEPSVHGARRKGKGIASAGDLMSSLPQEMRAENLMCYIGHEGTYTAAHREMCASLGQNIMVYSSGSVDEHGKAERPGSSIWFMTEKKDRFLVREYWASTLGHDIELETHFAQLAAWQKAPFTTYIVEQRIGDFVFVPPLAPHQVWNRGTTTIKVAWNRTTVETLGMALREALPKGRLACRDEQYKNKAIIYYTMLKYSGLLKQAQNMTHRSQAEASAISQSKRVKDLQDDFKALFRLFRDVLLSEMFAPDTRESCDLVNFDSNVTCSYCRGNIFNRFLTCKTCVDKYGGEDPYDVCMECYVIGRSCHCRSGLKWVEQFRWKELCARYEDWRKQITSIDGMTGMAPAPLNEERRLNPKKSLAQICQEQLKVRPFYDYKKPPDVEEEDEEEEIQMNDDGSVKKITKKKSKAYLSSTHVCHVCCGRHPKWKMAACKCGNYWCYGSLYRAHDISPQDVLEDPNWECPHCKQVCSAGACRNDPKQNSYSPMHTKLGYDTRKIADPRSVESLVDFSVSNIRWLAHGTGTPLDRTGVDDTIEDPIEYNVEEAIDPALGGAVGPSALEPAALLPDGGRRAEQKDADDLPEQNGQYSHPGTQIYPDLDDSLASGPFHVPASYAILSTNTISPATAKPGFRSVDSNGTTKRSRQEEFEPIRVIERKRRKANEDDELPVKNIAAKQYQQAREKQLLTEARKTGRYLQVWSMVHKKHLTITLYLSPEKLQAFPRDDGRAEAAPSRAEGIGNSYAFLRSNIEPQPDPATLRISSAQPKTKSYKARVEEDGTFRANGPQDRRAKGKQRYEEIIIESEDEEDAQDAQDAQGVLPSTVDRRRSTWLTKRREMDAEDIPEALPSDWKDGRVRKPLSAGGGARRTSGQKAPRIRPVSAGADDDCYVDVEAEDHDAGDDEAEGSEPRSPTNQPDEETPASVRAETDRVNACAGPPAGKTAGSKAAARRTNGTKAANSTSDRHRGSLKSRLGVNKKIVIVSAAARTGGKAKFVVSGGRKGPPGRTSLPA